MLTPGSPKPESNQPVQILDTDLDPINPATSDNQINGNQLTDLIILLHQLLNAMVDPGYLDKSINATRQTIVSGTVDTVTTVANITNLGVWSASQLQFDQSQNTWAVMCRSLIT